MARRKGGNEVVNGIAHGAADKSRIREGSCIATHISMMGLVFGPKLRRMPVACVQSSDETHSDRVP